VKGYGKLSIHTFGYVENPRTTADDTIGTGHDGMQNEMGNVRYYLALLAFCSLSCANKSCGCQLRYDTDTAPGLTPAMESPNARGGDPLDRNT
jgi:hypothetical protein